jgi:hypothetical protein
MALLASPPDPGVEQAAARLRLAIGEVNPLRGATQRQAEIIIRTASLLLAALDRRNSE